MTRRLMVCWDEIDVAYPSGDRSVLRTDFRLIDERKTVSDLIDTLNNVKAQHRTNFRIAGIDIVEDKQ